MNEYIFAPMNISIASEIVNWIYEEQYSIYSFNNTDETLDELLNNNYYAVLDDKAVPNELIGYFCFGHAAKIPTDDSDAYTDDAIDIGLGIKPQLCGKGLGYDFLNAGLTFAKYNMLEKKQIIRLTVAEFNQRAIHLYEKSGFVHFKTIKHSKTGKEFCIMRYIV